MTILEALTSLNSFPIPDNTIEKICVDRALVSSTEYDLTVSASEAYQLATADVYLYLSGQPILKEQEVSFSQTEASKANFLSMANAIYLEYEDDKYSGTTHGFVGEDYNG